MGNNSFFNNSINMRFTCFASGIIALAMLPGATHAVTTE